MQIKKIKKPDLVEWLLLGVLVMILILTVGINFHMARHVLDDDASSEMMLAELLHREKKLYSEDFYYSTEFFVQNQIVFGFLFNFFDGWANVRFFGTFIIQMLYLASFLYMMSESGLSRKPVLIGSSLIMLPFTVVYGRTILYHCYYVSNFIATYLITGLLFSFFKRKNAGKISITVRLALLVLLSFGSCLLYIRQMFLTMIPLFICLFFYLLAQYGESKTFSWRRKWMLLPLLLIAAGAAGMMVNTLVLIPSFDLYHQTEQNLNVLNTASWGPILAALLIQFGFRTQVKLFSLIGVLSLGGLFNSAVLMYYSGKEFLDKRQKDFRTYVMRTMMLVSLAVNLIIFIFGDIPYRLQADYSRYLVPASVWIIPLLCSEMEHLWDHSFFRKAIFYVCIGIFVLNGLLNASSFLNSKNFGQPYDGISYDNPHLADDLQSVTEFIRAHDYPLGYAFAGEANTLVELLNGYPVVSLRQTLDGAWEYTNWLSLKSYKEIPSDRAFLLIRKELLPLYEDSLISLDAERLYFDDLGYMIYDITGLGKFRNLIREPEGHY